MIGHNMSVVGDVLNGHIGSELKKAQAFKEVTRKNGRGVKVDGPLSVPLIKEIFKVKTPR
tara:strand:- start:12 stop:191 length:180 start_codon:yes stop_codon:yes gene_type:complete